VSKPAEPSDAFADYQSEQARPVTSDQPVTSEQADRRYGPGTRAARERHDELSMRDFLARADARRAAGDRDPERHGAGNAERLTVREHLELLATAEYLARAYMPSREVHHALRAGATWPQVAAAVGTSEAAARAAYQAWADGQHDMLRWTGGRLGMSDAEYAETRARAGEPEPSAAEAGAAAHRVLCAHADLGGRGAHWLAPGQTCTDEHATAVRRPAEREAEAGA
jgi:hypothetical protein